tara:strand:+ start:872 stop:1096 length:225 start_codon:yes stop_codon:yes gene_type:complete
MANTLNKIEVVTEHNQLQIRETTDSGGFHRRVLSPDQDVSGESEQVQEKAASLWTNEVKDKWATFKEEQNKEQR